MNNDNSQIHLDIFIYHYLDEDLLEGDVEYFLLLLKLEPELELLLDELLLEPLE
jgi:hypothetical protein